MELDIILDTTFFKFPIYASTDEITKPVTKPDTVDALKELRKEENIDNSDF